MCVLCVTRCSNIPLLGAREINGNVARTFVHGRNKWDMHVCHTKTVFTNTETVRTPSIQWHAPHTNPEPTRILKSIQKTCPLLLWFDAGWLLLFLFICDDSAQKTAGRIWDSVLIQNCGYSNAGLIRKSRFFVPCTDVRLCLIPLVNRIRFDTWNPLALISVFIVILSP